MDIYLGTVIIQIILASGWWKHDLYPTKPIVDQGNAQRNKSHRLKRELCWIKSSGIVQYLCNAMWDLGDGSIGFNNGVVPIRLMLQFYIKSSLNIQISLVMNREIMSLFWLKGPDILFTRAWHILTKSAINLCIHCGNLSINTSEVFHYRKTSKSHLSRQ